MLLWLILGIFAMTLPFGAAASTAQNQPVTLTIWHGWDGNRTAILREIFNAFEARYPWIKVEDTVLGPGQGGTLDTKLLVAVAGGAPPDVAMVRFSNVVTLGRKGQLLPLEPYLEKDGTSLANNFYPHVVERLKWAGQAYGLPLTMTGNSVLFWNADMFEEAGINPDTPPKTWSDLIMYAKKLTKKAADGTLATVGINVTRASASSVNFEVGTTFVGWLGMNGGSTFSPDGRSVQIANNRGLDTLRWLVDFSSQLGTDYRSGPYQVAARSGGGFRGPMYNKTQAMYVSWEYEYSILKAGSPTLRLRMGALPYNVPDWKQASGIDWTYAIPTGSKHPAEAWLLVKWLTMEAGIRSFMLQQGRPTALPNYNKSREYLEKNPDWLALSEIFEHSVPDPAPPVDWAQGIHKPLTNAFFGQSTPAAALAEAAQQAQILVDEFWASYK